MQEQKYGIRLNLDASCLVFMSMYPSLLYSQGSRDRQTDRLRLRLKFIQSSKVGKVNHRGKKYTIISRCMIVVSVNVPAGLVS